MRRSTLLLLCLVSVLMAGALFSYLTSGIFYVAIAGTAHQVEWVTRLREAAAAWGPLAPVVYTLVVIVEVLVAPIPGALLYAPGGAIFGGFAGGSLSLVGNVIGAGLACALGNLFGGRVLGRQQADPQLIERLRERGLWVVLLLRANPLTSSDLVSYAAGLAGVAPWKVAVGTLGMAPLCYLQSYFAEQIFTVLPGWLVIAGGAVLIIVVVAIAAQPRRTRVRPGTPEAVADES